MSSSPCRPIFLVFPGLDSFAPGNLEAISKSYGLDVNFSSFPTARVFVDVIAKQIEHFDALTESGIKANGFIGYSIGELTCAYADGAYSAREVLLMAYHLGRTIDQSRGMAGAMITTRITAEEAARFRDVFISGYETGDVLTLSGHQAAIKDVARELVNDGKEVVLRTSMDAALHSPEMSFLWSTAIESLFRISSCPKARSQRWTSSFKDIDADGTDYMRLCCPRYFIEMLVKPIRFNEACKAIGNDALVIEMGSKLVLKDYVMQNVANVTYLNCDQLALLDANQNELSKMTSLREVNQIREVQASV